MSDTKKTGAPSADALEAASRSLAMLQTVSDPDFAYLARRVAVEIDRVRREARAEAFDEAARAACRYCAEGKKPKLDRDCATVYVHLFQGYAPKDCKASGIHALLAKERA